MPWADCSAGTNELFGEDLPVIIRIDANQLMGELDVAASRFNVLFAIWRL